MAQDLLRARRAEHTVARWTTYFLFACLLLEAGTLASRLSDRAQLVRVAAGAQLLPGEAAAPAARHGVITGLKLAALFGTGIVWLIWLRQAYRNLRLVGSKRSRFAPRWAVGYWFIPFVNLVRAYQVMKDLWLRSESMNDRDGYDDLPAPAFLSGWWGISLAWGFLGPVLASLTRHARTPAELTNITDLGMLVDAVGIVAAVLAISVVHGIDRRQQCFSSSPRDLPAALARHHGATSPGGVSASDRA